MSNRKKLARLKVALDSFVVDRSLRFGLPGRVPALWFSCSDVEKKGVVLGNYAALRNDIDEAGRILTVEVEKNPLSKNAVISLGSLLCQERWTGYNYAWEKLSKLWGSIDSPEKINKTNFPFFALGVELALLCEPDLARRAIHDVYLPFIWKYERCDRKDYQPIFYWHVPKTGGTSVNSKLSKVWYKSGTTFLPSYITRRFFAYVIAEHDGVLPYISSGHISSKYIPGEAIREYRKLLVLRDPKERALSAWRQYRQNPAQRLVVLPQHGFVWDFFPIRTFLDWLKSAPVPVVNPLSWTFSAYSSSDIGLAVDKVVPIDDLDAFGAELLSSLNGNQKDLAFRASKNVTSKSIREGHLDCGEMKRFLEPDYGLYRKFNGFLERSAIF